ncbi:hypothetical protein Q1695_004869 [Nippostrongylus brasiliensis]|nr:hypothetical protein Q1695_004869 [Nippostrongylus brasiliensis]
MYERVTVAVLLLLTVSTYAGFFDDLNKVASDVGNFFSKQYHNAKDLWANSQEDLQQNIERVKELLKAIEDKAGEIKQEVNEAEKETIDAVHGFLNNVTEFGQKVAQDGKAKFEENEKEWQKMLDDIFTNSGLDKVVEELKKDSATTCAIVIALVAPVLLALTR